MALKRTSEIIRIGFSVLESAANTFTQEAVNLQLNPLDQEVFVVVAADLDPAAPFNVSGTNTQVGMSCSSTALTTLANLNNSSTIANAVMDIRQDPGGIEGVAFTRTSLDTPPAALDYIAIIATNDFFVQIEGVGNPSARLGFGALWGYRARADAATYAALVQSEVLSS